MTERGRGEPVDHGGSGRRARGLRALLTAVVISGAAATTAAAEYTPGLPPKVDPGRRRSPARRTRCRRSRRAPMPDQEHDERIFDADVAAGGTSYWFDRVLERPFLSNGDSYLYTRGRALYMYTHQPGTLGFAGGYAYRERPTGAQRRPLHGRDLRRDAGRDDRRAHAVPEPLGERAHRDRPERRRDEVHHPQQRRRHRAQGHEHRHGRRRPGRSRSPRRSRRRARAGHRADRLGDARYGLTTITPRLSGDGLHGQRHDADARRHARPGRVDDDQGRRSGHDAAELPSPTTEYERYRDYDADTAFKTHLREYNRWWVDNVPYIDIPDANVKKMSYYRTFLNRLQHVRRQHPGQRLPVPGLDRGRAGLQQRDPADAADAHAGPEVLPRPAVLLRQVALLGRDVGVLGVHRQPGQHRQLEQHLRAVHRARGAGRATRSTAATRRSCATSPSYAECDVKGQLAKLRPATTTA